MQLPASIVTVADSIVPSGLMAAPTQQRCWRLIVLLEMVVSCDPRKNHISQLSVGAAAFPKPQLRVNESCVGIL